jgi:hypothetical protein
VSNLKGPQLSYRSHYLKRSQDLGVATWTAEEFGDPEVILLSALTGQLVFCTLPLRSDLLWITIPFDHVSPGVPSFP